MSERKTNEAAFHDARLDRGDPDRARQSKYYWAVAPWEERFQDRVAALATGRDVLELGCFDGAMTVRLAGIARRVAAIDISPRAVEATRARAAASGHDNVEAFVCDAEHLEVPDASVDLVYGAGVIHHVDVGRTLREVSRVLRPGGVAAFREPLAHNPMINLYRRVTPAARTPDEHPLTTADLRLLRAVFPTVELEYFGFFALGVTPLAGWPGGRAARRALNALDGRVVNNRLLGRFAWQVSIYAFKA